MLCHATCNIYKFRIIIFLTYNFHSSQFQCQYITQAHINMIFTHNNILFIFLTIHTKWSSLGPIKIGHLSVPSLPRTCFGSIHYRITVIPKHSTKPEDIGPVIKTKSQHSPGLPRTNPKISNIQSQKSWD